MEPLWIIFLLLITLLIPSWRKNFLLSEHSGGGAVRRLDRREDFFDFLKGVAILAVLAIHTTYFFPKQEMMSGQNFLWWTNNLSRFAIPVFLICSGALLDPRSFSRGWWRGFWKAKVVRLLLPYVLVSILILGWRRVSLADVAEGMITGRFIVPFYFIIVLFQCYLAYPLLLALKKSRWFLPLALAVSLESFFYPSNGGRGAFSFFLQYLFFFAYGMKGREIFLSEGKDWLRKTFWMWAVFCGLTFSFFFLWPGRYFNNQYFYGPAIFHLLFIFYGSRNALWRGIAWTGKRSLWIFLIHFSLLGMIWQAFSLITGLNFYLFFGLFLLAGASASIALAAALERTYSKAAGFLEFRRSS